MLLFILYIVKNIILTVKAITGIISLYLFGNERLCKISVLQFLVPRTYHHLGRRLQETLDLKSRQHFAISY